MGEGADVLTGFGWPVKNEAVLMRTQKQESGLRDVRDLCLLVSSAPVALETFELMFECALGEGALSQFGKRRRVSR